MSDHYHYGYADERHSHREYADENHSHYDYADQHHRHYDDERTAGGLREDLGMAELRISELENRIDNELSRIWEHLHNMPGGT